ncbi:MAG: hypothetical protein NDJ92_17910 [Thermoanaerobaculia bacterium]|nr:hypothetical protein [Thermoanaerobaculia bacterium]
MEQQQGEVDSRFTSRRRYRRARMIVELTTHLIRHDGSLTHREAHCLIECAHKAMNSISPEMSHDFASRVAPSLKRIIFERWPAEEAEFVSAREIVN